MNCVLNAMTTFYKVTKHSMQMQDRLPLLKKCTEKSRDFYHIYSLQHDLKFRKVTDICGASHDKFMLHENTSASEAGFRTLMTRYQCNQDKLFYLALILIII